ncbi:MAG: inositol monophosphatase [Gammaproteobacteria bacterium]|nr:inositol monophosphatase [Gammaproteobacteria bacterium]
MNPMLNIAIRAARAAGDDIIKNLPKVPDLKVNEKARNDFVSYVDLSAEEKIVEILLKAYPDHSILAEESGKHEGNDYRWIIDPLDGTANYLHGFPQYAVSIALQYKGRLEVGVVYDPYKQELFAASRGDGATLNDRRIRVTPKTSTRDALLGTGFPFRNRQLLGVHNKMLCSFFDTAADIRRAGSAALDLAYVAAGRLDGYWEVALQPWDIAAGALIVREAGGIVGDIHGQDNFLKTGHIVTGNPRIFADMIRKIKPYVSEVDSLYPSKISD